MPPIHPRWPPLKPHFRIPPVTPRNHFPLCHDQQTFRADTDGFNWASVSATTRLACFADWQTLILQIHDGRVLVGHHVIAAYHIYGAGHLCHMQAHKGDVQHVGIAKGC